MTTASGVSNAFVVSKNLYSPGFFLVTEKYPAAVHVNGTYMGPVGLLPGATFAPAAPGETIELFGTGFGITDPVTPSASLVGAPSALANAVTFSIGGQAAPVLFAGVTGSGLVQFNVTLPAGLPDGDAVLTATVQGIATPGAVMLTVHH